MVNILFKLIFKYFRVVIKREVRVNINVSFTIRVLNLLAYKEVRRQTV